MQPLLKLHHIKYSYHSLNGETTALADISFDVAAGEFVAIVGPSGCGKTTILRMIAGFEMPTDGEILLGGKDISRELPLHVLSSMNQRCFC